MTTDDTAPERARFRIEKRHHDFDHSTTPAWWNIYDTDDSDPLPVISAASLPELQQLRRTLDGIIAAETGMLDLDHWRNLVQALDPAIDPVLLQRTSAIACAEIVEDLAMLRGLPTDHLIRAAGPLLGGQEDAEQFRERLKQMAKENNYGS